MKTNRNLVTLITATLTLASGHAAFAGEQYSFPSPNGALVAATAPHFAPVAADPQSNLTTTVGGTSAVAGLSVSNDKTPPLPIGGHTYKDRFGMHAQGGDAYSYRFLTNALASQSFANYAADYYRLFTPGYAVTAWTDRVYGLVELGYGGAVDSWTGGAYYLGKVRGPSRRRDSAPDLSVMPTFRAHPELEEKPVFSTGQ
jgi:hypothetical protein